MPVDADVSEAEKPSRPWRELRQLARKVLTAHPEWKALQAAERLKIDSLRREEIEALCRRLGIDLDAL